MTNTHVPEIQTDIERHFPPQPESDGTGWNPHTNEWAPSNEQHSVFGVGEPSHGDVEHASPMTDSEGHVDEGGSTPDARANLLTDIKGGGQAAPVPPIVVRHIVETHDASSTVVRGRTVGLPVFVAGVAPTTLLDENEGRDRAILKNITGGGNVLIMQGKAGANAAAIAMVLGAPLPGFVLLPGESLEVKAGAMVEAIALGVASSVSVWDELTLPSGSPGAARL